MPEMTIWTPEAGGSREALQPTAPIPHCSPVNREGLLCAAVPSDHGVLVRSHLKPHGFGDEFGERIDIWILASSRSQTYQVARHGSLCEYVAHFCYTHIWLKNMRSTFLGPSNAFLTRSFCGGRTQWEVMSAGCGRRKKRVSNASEGPDRRPSHAPRAVGVSHSVFRVGRTQWVLSGW